jgi:hypothetical protein
MADCSWSSSSSSISFSAFLSRVLPQTSIFIRLKVSPRRTYEQYHFFVLTWLTRRVRTVQIAASDHVSDHDFRGIPWYRLI